MYDQWPGRTRVWRLAAAFGAFLVSLLILFYRDVDHVLRPELWAEDGWLWYPDAYTNGLSSLLSPAAGYFQTVSRLVGLVAQAFPLVAVPGFFAVSALVIQSAPALFLVSPRMSEAWPDPVSRAGFALAILVLPNTTEVYDNLTNSQWHLAVLAFLVVVSRPPRTGLGWCFDIFVLTVAGLSGPFCVFLAPVAVLRAWFGAGATTKARAAIVLATAALQAVAVVVSGHVRTTASLGAGPRMMARIVVEQILFGGLFGQANMHQLTDLAVWESNLLPVGAALLAAGLGVAVLARGPPLVRYSLLFAVPLFGAALLRPQISMTLPQWPLMLIPGIGTRYFFIPMLAWLGVVFTLAAGYVAWLRWVGIALLATFVVGFGSDYFYPARPRTDFDKQARLFAGAAPGTVMAFPVLPQGVPPMVLVKRAR